MVFVYLGSMLFFGRAYDGRAEIACAGSRPSLRTVAHFVYVFRFGLLTFGFCLLGVVWIVLEISRMCTRWRIVVFGLCYVLFDQS